MRGASRISGLGAGLVALAVAGFAPAARADVSYTEKVHFNDIGGLGKSEITRHVYLSGMKEREESIMKMVDATGYPAGVTEKRDLKIFRLDKDALWTLNPDAKTYTISTIEEAKALALATVAQAPPDQMREAPTAQIVLAIKKANLNRKVGPWEAEEVVLTILTEEQDAKTGEKRPVRLVCDLWVALGVPAQGELREFSQAYMDKLEAVNGMAGMQLLTACFPKSFARAFEAIKGIPGTPVEWTWSVERALSGADAADLKQDIQIQEEGGEDELQVQAREGAYDKNEPKNLETRSPDAPAKASGRTEAPRGGSEAAAEVSGISEGDPQGIRVIMKVTTVLDRIDAAPIVPDLFEIPAGYAKASPGK